MSAERQRPRAAYVPTQTKERAVIRSEERTSADFRNRSSGVSEGKRADGGGPLDGHACPLAEPHAQTLGGSPRLRSGRALMLPSSRFSADGTKHRPRRDCAQPRDNQPVMDIAGGASRGAPASRLHVGDTEGVRGRGNVPPVSLTQQQNDLLQVIVHWAEAEEDYDRLPEGIFDLPHALDDDLHDTRAERTST